MRSQYTLIACVFIGITAILAYVMDTKEEYMLITVNDTVPPFVQPGDALVIVQENPEDIKQGDLIIMTASEDNVRKIVSTSYDALGWYATDQEQHTIRETAVRGVVAGIIR